MGLRAARNSFAALAALCLLAVPAAASAEEGRGRSHVQTQAESRENGQAKDEPKGEAAKGRSGDAKGKPTAAPTTSPQPKSNADRNPGGANNGGDCGAYCSTRDGSPSENGKGEGEASGKPCAGCVGKADNKNPPGQQPDGTDHNAGYECDRNQGIGKTNPAHTGCSPTSAPSVSPTGSPCVPSDSDSCEPPCVPTAADPCEPPCVPTADEPCEPCVPTAGEPCEPCVPTADEPCEPVCVPTAEEPCETATPTPSVIGTGSERPETPPMTPSVKGVKFTRSPAANPPAVLGSRLPTTGNTVSVGLLLLLGFGLVGFGVFVTVATPARHH